MGDEKFTVDQSMLRKDGSGNLRIPEPLVETAGLISAKEFALSPLDGRYANIGKKLSPYFSEYALIKNRVKVEVYWLNFLIYNLDSEILDSYFLKEAAPEILSIYENFSDSSYLRIKEFEAVTNHDVKAVELYVAEQLKEMGFDDLVSFVHIGCTSEDITNAAYARMINDALNDIWIPAATTLLNQIGNFATEYASTPMLAHTHGQPATPTTVGKEFAVFFKRRQNSLDRLQEIKTLAKFNGATGNYAALSVAFPDVDWPEMANNFIEDYLDLYFNPVTTQIENHDYICQICDEMRHFNNILQGFDLDMWLYISMEYIKQIPVKSEVGSSTMPHKVNPIRFENSESNIDTSNALLTALSNKLSKSRMQRDLSDSSSMRNIGIAFGYSLQAIEQTSAGLQKIAINTDKISKDLNNNWEVLAEPIQTMRRKYGIPDAYDQLKERTRGKRISKEDIHEFIKSVDVFSKKDRDALLALTPETYIGYSATIVEDNL